MDAAENLVNNIESSIERVNSAVWSEEETYGTNGITRKAPKQQWVAKGLVPRQEKKSSVGAALKLAATEFFYGLGRGAALGFGLKGGMVLLFSLLKRKKWLKIREAVLSADVLRFTKFLAMYIGLLRGSNSFLAAVRGINNKSNGAMAGAIASIAILLDDRSRRKDISLYLFFRAIYIFTLMLVRKQILPYIWWFDKLIFGVINVPIMYGFLYEPDILQKGYYNWILMMGNVNGDNLDKALRMRRDHFKLTGEMGPFIPCNPYYHEGPCTTYCITDWFSGIGRASKVYAPVHLLPLLLFKHQQLLTAPGPTLLKTGKDYLASCLFLTTYQSIQKVNVCTTRSILHRDPEYMPVIGGLLTSFATVFEKKSRVTELLLYCAPRGAEGAWNWLRKYGYISDVPNAEVFLFSVASAVLMSASNEDFKPTYYKGLKFLIGS